MQAAGDAQDFAAPSAGPSTERTDPAKPPSLERAPARPPNVTHLSTPAYESPLRHHRRQPSAPHQVKETLHAHSEYTNADGDGAAIHRINQYVIKQEIGRGSFGAVHLAVDQDGREYAVKEFSKSRLRKRAQSNILRRPHAPKRQGRLGPGPDLHEPIHRRSASEIHEEEGGTDSLHLIQQEIAIMKKLNHDNLVSLFEVLDDPTEDSLYMVLEMCKKGVIMRVGMSEVADPYAPENCRYWFRDLVLGIEYLHAQGVAHRDIKPDNLLLTHDDVLKIVDFGVSEMFEKHSDMTTNKSAGSPAFLPPELCTSQPGGISGKAADVWSMGITLYCLYFGKVPFEKTAVIDLYESIKNDVPELEQGEEDFLDLMRRLLEKDPTKRISIPEIREHPWVTRRGTDPLLSADENTSDIVEYPTKEEVERAITSNLSKLLVVVKAVRKFKSLLGRRRPRILDSILGESGGIVQPPLTIDPSAPRPQHTHAPSQSVQPLRNNLRPDSRPNSAIMALHNKAFSEATHDRRPIEQALAREGVHHRIDADQLAQRAAHRGDDASKYQPIVASPVDFKSSMGHGQFAGDEHRHASKPPPGGKRDISSRPERHRAGPSPGNSGSTDSSCQRSPYSPGKGRAHDPLEDFLFLAIGPGNDRRRQSTTDRKLAANATAKADGTPPADGTATDADPLVASPAAASDAGDPDTPVVSESPPAADEDIFALAYDAEARRIRAETEDACLFSTRRVERDGGLAGAREVEIDQEGQRLDGDGGGRAGANSRFTEPGAAGSMLAGLVKGFKKDKKEGDNKDADRGADEGLRL